MHTTITTKLPIVLGLLVIVVLCLYTIQDPFFWDTIQLGSKQGTYFYTTNFESVLLPDQIDSGHIPGFGAYLAIIWHLFSRSLIVSHIAMWPFIIGICWHLHKLVATYVSIEHLPWAFLLILIDPTLLAQITLVSPDIPLLFFFLLGLNSLHDKKRILLTIAIMGLFLVSMRGMMLAFCLLILDCLSESYRSTSLRKLGILLIYKSRAYIPAFVLFLAYFTYHYQIKGWVGYHEDSPWAPSFEAVNLLHVIRNIGILGWRMLDFGRIGIWLAVCILLFKYKKTALDAFTESPILKPVIIVGLGLGLQMIWAGGLLGHRYLLPMYILIALLVVVMLFKPFVSSQLRKGLITIWVTMLVTGHLWIYPASIAQGWDSSLAYLPYQQMRKEMIHYIDQKGIKINEVQAFFPALSTLDECELNNDVRQFSSSNDELYLLDSNVFNLPDSTLNKIESDFTIINAMKRGGITLTLYQKVKPN
jgi:hypothetical protein